MNVIILAAGQGKRLRPLTDDVPKCMIELFGKTILKHQLDVFQECGIENIQVVTGYKSELINYPDIECIKNTNFEKSNMMESLFCAREYFTDSTIISYGDIIYEKRVLQRLIDSEEDFSVIVDKNWEEYWSLRFEDPIQDLESMSINSDGYITSIGKKIDGLNDIQGQYIGLMKFQNDAISRIKEFYDKVRMLSLKNKNPLNERLSFENSYMTDFLQGLIDEGNRLKSVEINSGWLELDNMDDFELYKKLYSNGEINRFLNFN